MLTEPSAIAKWEAAKTISFRGNIFEKLEGEPKCENLLTLDLSVNRLKKLPKTSSKTCRILKSCICN